MKINWTIGTKLLGGTAALFVLAGILSSSGLSNAGRFKDRFDEVVDRNVQKVALSNQIGTANWELVAAQRGVILAAFAKDHAEFEKDRQIFEQKTGDVRKALDEMRTLIFKDEAEALVAEIATQLAEWQPHFEEVARQSDAGQLAEANRIRKDITAPIFNKIAAASLRLQGIEAEILAEDKAAV